MNKISSVLDKFLVENWRDYPRWFSTHLAALCAALGGVVAANPELLLQLIFLLPDRGWLRWVVVGAVVVVIFVVPLLSRLWGQTEEVEDDT